MAKEITLIAAECDYLHAKRMSLRLLDWFTGYTRVNCWGGWTAGGTRAEEPAIMWIVATNLDAPAIETLVADWAKQYCTTAAQECIYFKDKQGLCWLVNRAGEFSNLED